MTKNRELTYEEAESLGYDGTGRDGDPRFPYHLSDALSAPKHDPVVGCRACASTDPMTPLHFASTQCESGQHPHCTCDMCF